MVATTDRLPLHRPVWTWSERQLDRLDDPSIYAMLSDAALDKLITELDAWIDG
jgi:hypothetical protein